MTVEVIGISVAVLALFCVAIALRSYSKQRSKFKFVHVNEDGSVRELTPDEKEYLSTKFRGSDGARPYIKTRYEQLTPDGKIWGFLYRDKVPPGIKISKA